MTPTLMNGSFKSWYVNKSCYINYQNMHYIWFVNKDMWVPGISSLLGITKTAISSIFLVPRHSA